jgi:hypothetical protein
MAGCFDSSLALLCLSFHFVAVRPVRIDSRAEVTFASGPTSPTTVGFGLLDDSTILGLEKSEMATPKQPNQGRKRLTPRQAALAKNLLNGATITDAARNAGYSEKNLAQSGHQALKAIRLSMPELMDEIGLTERALIEKHLVPLLSATTTKYFQHHGKVKQKRQVADNDARLRALDVALRLRGSYAPKGPEAAEAVRVRVLVLDVPRPDRSAFLPKQQPVSPSG